MNPVDSVIGFFSPKAGLRRTILRDQIRQYDAATTGRRAAGMSRTGGDANKVISASIAALRSTSRGLIRNNGWARRGMQIVGNNTVGWGIVPRFKSEQANTAWKLWANTPSQCDYDGALTFYGIQRLVMDTVFQSGSAFVLRHMAPAADGGLKIQVMEPDLLDNQRPDKGFEMAGRTVVAYWFKESLESSKSYRVLASDCSHVRIIERPGQLLGVPWLTAVAMRMHDFDVYEDAVLMRQKIAACFAVFVTDIDGAGGALAEDSGDPFIDKLQPGLIKKLAPGQDVSFASPPSVTDNDSFSKTTHHAFASGIGVTYEELTGDFSKVNFSSARMSRLAAWENVKNWRWNMLIPQMCVPVAEWFGVAFGLSVDDVPDWTAPPMPMIEPDKEGSAYRTLIRTGAMTPNEMVLERGLDPVKHWTDYGNQMSELDAKGIVLDCDVRKVSDAGLTQQRAGTGQGTQDEN